MQELILPIFLVDTYLRRVSPPAAPAATRGAAQGFSGGDGGEIRFQSVGDDEGRYSHIQAVLKRFAYPRLKRADKGLVLRYLGRTTGYSRQQLTRLVR